MALRARFEGRACETGADTAERSKQVTQRAKGASLRACGIRTTHEERNSRSSIHELEHSCCRRSLRRHGSHCLSVGADVTEAGLSACKSRTNVEGRPPSEPPNGHAG